MSYPAWMRALTRREPPQPIFTGDVMLMKQIEELEAENAEQEDLIDKLAGEIMVLEGQLEVAHAELDSLDDQLPI